MFVFTQEVILAPQLSNISAMHSFFYVHLFLLFFLNKINYKTKIKWVEHQFQETNPLSIHRSRAIRTGVVLLQSLSWQNKPLGSVFLTSINGQGNKTKNAWLRNERRMFGQSKRHDGKPFRKKIFLGEKAKCFSP